MTKGSKRRLFPYYHIRSWMYIRAPYCDYTLTDLEKFKRAVGSGETGVPVELPWVLEMLHRTWWARCGARPYEDQDLYRSLLKQAKMKPPNTDRDALFVRAYWEDVYM